MDRNYEMMYFVGRIFELNFKEKPINLWMLKIVSYILGDVLLSEFFWEHFFSMFIKDIWMVIFNDTLYGLSPAAKNEPQKFYENQDLIKSGLKSCFSALQSHVDLLDSKTLSVVYIFF